MNNGKFELYIGNHKRVIGTTVYHKQKNKYIPCMVTNYYFKSRKYVLVPVGDLENIPTEEHEKRRVFYTTKIYKGMEK